MTDIEEAIPKKDKSDKELAIEVAERLGEAIEMDNVYKDLIWVGNQGFQVEKYLHDKAAEILFMDGMAGKIKNHFMPNKNCTRLTVNRDIKEVSNFMDFWKCNDNNGTLNPRKIIEVWINLND